MAKDKASIVMREFKRGKLKSGSGGKVKNRKQAIAIALSEQRKQGGKMPSYYDSKSTKPKKSKVKKYQGGGAVTPRRTPSRRRPRGSRGGPRSAMAAGRSGHPRSIPTFYHPNARRLPSVGFLTQDRSQTPSGSNRKKAPPPALRIPPPPTQSVWGGSVNQLIDRKYKHGGRIKHNPSTINP